MAVGTTAFPTSLDTVVELIEAANNSTTTLDGALDNSVTTIPVVSTASFPSSGTISIDSEIISYTGKTGASFTGCTRGFESTSAASHLNGATVDGEITARHHNVLASALIAVETKLGLGTAIAVNKLAALTASRAVVTDASGFISAASVTAAEIGYLAGVTTPTGSGALVLATSPTLTTPTIAKLANLTTNGFVKTSGGDGTLSVDTSTYLTANQTITLSGDVTGSGSTAITTTIANDAVTYAKMQDISATQRVLGRNTAGAGNTEEVTITQLLDWAGTAAQGDILYRGASAWALLPAGTNGHYLKTQGAAANPVWAAVSGGGLGDVVGPGSATDNAVVRFDLTTGKLVQDSVVTIADTTGNMAGVGTLNGHTIPVGTDTFVLLTANQTLTTKTLTSPDINGGTADSLTSLSVRSTGAAFDLLFANTEVLTGNKTLTFKVNDTSRTVDIAGNLTIAANFTTSGANALTLTTTGATNVTLPTTGTLVNSAVTSLSSLTTVGTITSGGLGTGAVIGGVTMTLGSDADGDMYYRASGVLTRLAKGTALQQLRMNAGATAPEWAAAASGGITVGTTTITSGTNTLILYNNSGVVGEYTVTGSGNVVMSTGPTLTDFTLSGNISAAAWTTNGVRIKGVASTLTDTTSSGTVAAAVTNVLGGNTIAASNPTTYTDYFTTRMAPPTAGTNVTFTRSWALGLTGSLQVAPAARTGTPAQAFQLITPADTGLTASTEQVLAYYGGTSSGTTATRTWANGAITTQREHVFVAPTYAFVSGSNTITTAATVAITGAPSAGSFGTITNKYSLWVQTGLSRFDHNIEMRNAGGTTDLTIYSGSAYALFRHSSGTTFETYLLSGTTVWNIIDSGFTPIATFDNATGIVGVNKSSSLGGQLHVVSRSASRVGLRVDSAATPSVNIFETTVNGGAGTGFVVTSTGAPSSPGAAGSTTSERYGQTATANTDRGTAFGAASNASAAAGTAIGYSTLAGTAAVAVGTEANAGSGNTSSTVVGYQGRGGDRVTAIGFQAGKSVYSADNTWVGYLAGPDVNTWTGSVALGNQSIVTASNQFVSGSSSWPVTNLFFGKGVTNATPTAYTINGTGGSGSNIAGAALNLAGGKGTGTGTGGDVNIQFARAGSTGSSLNSLSTIMAFSGTTTATTATQTNVNGATTIQGQITESVTLSTSGTTTDSTIDLPANSIILSVTGRVTTTITTATDWKLGDATIADRFSDANATLTSGTTTVGINQWKADRTTAGQGAFQQSTAKVRITTTGTPGAGVIRIMIHYITLSAPTS